jgi:acetyl esterase/lipase
MKSIWSRCPRWFRIAVLLLAILTVVLIAVLGCGYWYLNPSVVRTDGVVYGMRDGTPLTLDVLRPQEPNGLAVAFMVSGGWKSGGPGETPTWMLAPLLRSGYTVFAICHISQPDSTVMEIIEDVNRGIRYVRHHAGHYGIDPNRIGVSGGSAGGHLSLMLATRGEPGDSNAKDPIDRESSEVQAVAIFYPVTDLLDMGTSTENPGDGGPPISFVKAFGPDATDMEKWKKIGRDCSPIFHLTEDFPPTLICHGDADTLVPLTQSQRFQKRAAECGHDVELMIHPGGEHGWPTMIWDALSFVAWFDEHLRR